MNQCEQCTACCTVLGVRQLRKDDYHPCEHCGQGCNIYATRPAECQNYSCFWLTKEHNAPECRPDRCGLILESTQTTIGQAIVCREVRPGAFEESIANAWAYRVARQFNAYLYVISATGDRRAIFPSWVAHLAASAQKLVSAYKSWRELEAEEQATAMAEASRHAAEERRLAEAEDQREREEAEKRERAGPAGQYVDDEGRLRLVKMRHPSRQSKGKGKAKATPPKFKVPKRARRAIFLDE